MIVQDSQAIRSFSIASPTVVLGGIRITPGEGCVARKDAKWLGIVATSRDTSTLPSSRRQLFLSAAEVRRYFIPNRMLVTRPVLSRLLPLEVGIHRLRMLQDEGDGAVYFRQ